MTKQLQFIRLGGIIAIGVILFFGGRELMYFERVNRSLLVEQLDVEDLTEQSDVIFIGTIQDAPQKVRYRDENGEVVVESRWQVFAEQIIKGSPEDKIFVRTLGGQYGLTQFWVEDEAQLQEGERTLLYLALDSTSGDYRVKGFFQGHFSLSKDAQGVETALQQETGNAYSLQELTQVPVEQNLK